MAIPNYELKYFNLRGLGEPIRLMLYYLEIPFKDTHIDIFTEWMSVKPKMPFKTLPVFIDGSFMLSQTIAIMRYLAKKHGLVAKSLRKKALCDMYGEQIQDHYNAIRPWIGTKVWGLEQLEEKFTEIFIPEITEKFGPNFEPILERNSSGYLVGNCLTWVDFQLADFADKCIVFGKEDIFEHFPKVQAHRNKIFTLHTLEEYLKNRPEYPF